MCAHKLRFAQSLGEKRSEGHDSVSGPQKFELREGSVSCQGVRSDCAPFFLVSELVRWFR